MPALIFHRSGDSLNTWEQYRISIAQTTAFASMFQIPMMGADVCGFGSDATEELCARWASLGAFYTFYRNHNAYGSVPQEFYRWETVTEAARKAITIRYRLLDYIYTAFQRQSETGEPFLQPLFYLYPEDENTFDNDLQFFYGDALLISPVTEESSTSVDAYFPDDIFYELYTGTQIQGQGAQSTLTDIHITDIPIHIRGGSIIPLRSSGAMTTTELRKKPFELIVAPGSDGTASGSLYVDDGDSLEQNNTTNIEFEYRNDSLSINGKFSRNFPVHIESVTLLGQTSANSTLNRKQVITGRKLVLTKPTTVKLL